MHDLSRGFLVTVPQSKKEKIKKWVVVYTQITQFNAIRQNILKATYMMKLGWIENFSNLVTTWSHLSHPKNSVE